MSDTQSNKCTARKWSESHQDSLSDSDDTKKIKTDSTTQFKKSVFSLPKSNSQQTDPNAGKTDTSTNANESSRSVTFKTPTENNTTDNKSDSNIPPVAAFKPPVTFKSNFSFAPKFTNTTPAAPSTADTSTKDSSAPGTPIIAFGKNINLVAAVAASKEKKANSSSNISSSAFAKFTNSGSDTSAPKTGDNLESSHSNSKFGSGSVLTFGKLAEKQQNDATAVSNSDTNGIKQKDNDSSFKSLLSQPKLETSSSTSTNSAENSTGNGSSTAANPFGQTSDNDPNDSSTKAPLFGSTEVPIETFEEDETTIFSSKAKLYELTSSSPKHSSEKTDDGENSNNDTADSANSASTSSNNSASLQNWAERGLGLLKLNTNNTTNKSRLIMRTNVTFRLILNVMIFDQIKPINENSFVRLSVFDPATNLPITYAIRLKSPEIAADLVDAINSLI
ncbi:Nuclear pore complex protein NUP50A [Smittium culicis]|uniref:Nuclear pore complex protein NUP50A n=1 Tax=Smittium culicis TaxID=133412 RepID=A0A1R1YH90_9FUNG|nr:Nuclear pore complex protein NUP50A [Smittium culicis]